MTPCATCCCAGLDMPAAVAPGESTDGAILAAMQGEGCVACNRG